ncbi:MAG TPA: DnaJ domain-containing protein [Stellaceae bacterium]|nr:DnaJ domain-containing protein [Stellaceae bacterium]
MPYLIFGVVLLGLLLLAARAIVNADAAQLGRFLVWLAAGIGMTAAAAGLLFLIVTDRWAPALVLAGGLAPLVLRRRARWRRRYGAATGGGGERSEVQTEFLRMKLEHDTGVMTGTVRRGAFAGRALEDLDRSEMLTLWRLCLAEDEQGARLLETYLDRFRPDWRKGEGASAGSGAGSGAVMTRDQAYAILDLKPGASPDEIREAHRRLMMKLHPDHGGSTYLAAEINRAKDLLLGT